MQSRGSYHWITRALVALLAVSLSGCGATPRHHANIRPSYTLKNSPIPFPRPKRRADVTAAQAAARRSAGGRITVARGDTMYGLARRYGVSLEALIASNAVPAPYRLEVGQRLRLPTPAFHTVKRGETGYSISRQHRVTVAALMRENNIRPPYRLAVGQRLQLPRSNQGATDGARQSSSGRAVQNARDTARPKSTARPSGQSRPSKKASEAKPAATPAIIAGIPAPPPRSSSKFAWPVSGRITSSFGAKGGGLHNDGINIAARAGTPVRAAEAGVVAYASNALEGYGNLLLIKHAGGYVTAYAHNERLLVRPGQKVGRAEVIARVGSTGDVDDPQLHFEVRRGRRALNPISLLEARAEARAKAG